MYILKQYIDLRVLDDILKIIMETQQSNITKKVISGVIALGVLIGITSMIMKDKTPDPATVPPRQDTVPTDTATPNSDDTDSFTTPTSPESTKVQSTTYTDGTYSASGTYKSPAGSEEVLVTLVVQNDTVLSSTFSATSDSGTSKNFQKQFADGYISQVVGKKLSDINVGKVSGSSLTAKGFNDALSQIKAQAKI